MERMLTKKTILMKNTGTGIIGELFTFSRRLMSFRFPVSYPGTQILRHCIQCFVLCGTRLCPLVFWEKHNWDSRIWGRSCNI